MSYQQKIKTSSMMFTIRRNATQIIDRWHQYAKNHYKALKYTKPIHDDELEIENAFIEHFSNALESLVNNKSKDSKSIPGWSFGYICGHAQGSLNINWTNKYIIVLSNDFKDLLKLRSMVELLRVDNDTLRKLKIIFDYYTENKQKTSTEDISSSKVISLIKYGTTKNKIAYRKEFYEYFEKLFTCNYMSLLNRHDAMCCPDLTDYFNEYEFVNIVGKEHFA